jgi:tetratricopeptide (TPR) repeat protein
MKKLMLLCFFAMIDLCYGQPNCEAYKYYGEMSKFEACKKAEESGKYYQFTKEYQEILDAALEIDSSYAYAYQAKGYAYLKSGDFITWEKLMSKAVRYEPALHLGYRGWCRYQFFRDYKGAIEDIERLESLVEGDIGFGQNGDYHLKIAKALCYKALGEKDKAIEIIEEQLGLEDHFVGLYDYLHLGILYLETNQLDKALHAFQNQEKENTLAENEFYRAVVYKKKKDKARCNKHLQKAYELYQNGRHMFDFYTHQMDRVFLSDIKTEIAAIN